MSRSYPARPLVGVGVCVLRQHEVLLIRRGRAPAMGQWSLPGGAQRLGETVEAAARREVREEAGITLSSLILAAVIDSIHYDALGTVEYHYTIIDYAARWTGGLLRAGGDAHDAQWVDVERLGAFSLAAETLRVITIGKALIPLDTA